jgi:glycosidase
VRDEIRKILSFWLEEGVDGFRLDAVTYYYTGNDEQNIRFLNWVKDTADESAADLADAGGSFSPYIVCEAWIDQSLYAAYYASGVDSMFDFAYAGAEGLLAKTVKGQVSAQKFTDSLKAEQELFASFSNSYVNAPFYTNHDLDRSAGYYAYDDGSRTKFALGLNLMISGNAFLYYGDEIGMKGSGKDENKRAPMMWVPKDTDNPSAAGMCTGPEGMDSIKQKFPSAAEQENDPLSVLNYTKQAIAVRNKYNVIRDGIVIPIPELESDTVGAYRKVPGSPESGPDQESVEILFNTSEETQTVDLSSLRDPFLTLADCLCVSADPVLLDEGQLTLPPFSVAILKK